MAVFNFTEMTFTLCILTWSVHTEPGAGFLCGFGPFTLDRRAAFAWGSAAGLRDMPVQPWTGRFPRSQLFDEQRTDGVEHCQDHHTHIGEDGQPHIGEPQGHKHQTRQLDADGKDDVFIDDP